jgi:hypothetical protein
MKNSDGIKEGNVLWRIDFTDEFDSPMYCFSLEDAHKIARTRGNKPYIITMLNGDRLQSELTGKR